MLGVALFAVLLLVTQTGRLAHSCPMLRSMAPTVAMSAHCAAMAQAAVAGGDVSAHADAPADGTASQCADHCKGGIPAVDESVAVTLPAPVYLALFIVGLPLPMPMSVHAGAWRERRRRRERTPPPRLSLLQGRLRD